MKSIVAEVTEAVESTATLCDEDAAHRRAKRPPN